MHTLIILEENKAQFVCLFFTEKKVTLKMKKIIICKWTVMLMEGRQCISRVILNHIICIFTIYIM